MLFIKTIFIISLLLIIYIYIAYPLILFILYKLKKNKLLNKMDNYEPLVSIIIPARNEEKIIRKKIENTLQLNYSREKTEIIIISDNSTDNTNKIVQEYKSQGVKLITLQKHMGKTTAQNIAVEKSTGNILIFSDANALYIQDAVKHLVKHFYDKNVGCVSGELWYKNLDNNIVGKKENLYWSYEKLIKKFENRVFTILGANGSIYAVRKSDYVYLLNTDISDFIEPLKIAENGKKVIYEKKAISFEAASNIFKDELDRKKRIINRSINSIATHNSLINPFKNFILSWELLSHKVLRWFSPFFILLLFIMNLILFVSGKFHFIFYLQIIFYSISLFGLIIKNFRGVPSWLFIPYYFCLLEYASTLGILEYLKGQKIISWDPQRQ
ncbi:MAG: glycosyltransferase family 2 protein [bacterium]